MRVSVPKLAASIAVGIVVLVLIVRARETGVSLQLIDQSQGGELWTLVRQMEARGLEAPEPGVADATRIVREPLDEQRAMNFFPVGGNHAYDPHTYFRYRPNMTEKLSMPDYPGGAWTRRTNAQGLREDRDLAPVRPDIFVLVAGDSHTEGICDNDQTFANRLEALLGRAHPGRSVEVLNTGCAAYSFYNYLGALERFEELRPAVFVTAFFGGNDFVECLALYHYFHRTQRAAADRDAWDRLKALQDVGEFALAQGLSSASYFGRFPDEVDCSLRAALEVGDEIQRRCSLLGAHWIVVYIPSVFDLPDSEAKDRLESARGVLKLSDDDLRTGNKMADRLVQALRERGVEVVDMREHFTPAGRPWYWTEYHINLKAQARIAELLLPRVEARIPTR